ncbi:DUF3298 and DUF4163 domain-containing protein [Asticcacaulis sp. EMRT-3]|uniref:DUF3298 and DUF4163 domain-containing protein n=1 Tax=Asticcacaulis sp. EMRT-3 TaxID=3040349 RepID=UPI0024AF96F9|nr:DUF3298 and DUF4163 domain-containing protein [Asticcacaulis sp. EMRT-3]MDI7774078.1 DUF4163 domain-containing protein [Asticcacaulis sp. EMRT-3]
MYSPKRNAYLPAALALSLLAVCALSACHQKPTAEKAPTTPPATVAPLGFAKTTDDAQVSLTLPDPIKLYPKLHTRLYKEGQAALTAFLDQAHKDRAESSADGIAMPAYYHAINWKIAAQSSRFVSLYAEEDDYQGGAHPNSTFHTLLWDKTKNDLVPVSSLFAPHADMSAVDSYLCHQIEAERARRTGEPVNQAQSGFACPHLADSRLILIPSTIDGKIGAIDALFAPYEIGPYAEGPYEIRVPQSQLKSVIAPQWADQFDGEAIKEAALPDPDSDKDKAQ